MSRKSGRVVGTLLLALALLVFAVAAMASQAVVPKVGLFKGTTSQPNPAAGSNLAYFKVSKHGSRRAVFSELKSVVLTCEAGVSTTIPKVITSKSFKENGKGAPLPVKKGKFFYKGPIYKVFNTVGQGEISGTFKSPAKVVGRARFKWSEASLAGITASCDSGALTFTSTHK
jgi:hypothetical protein